jgi:hypothetical protein
MDPRDLQQTVIAHIKELVDFNLDARARSIS